MPDGYGLLVQEERWRREEKTAMDVDIVAVRKLCSPFDVDDWPHLVCPSCGIGRLVAHRDHFERHHTAAFRDVDDPEDTQGTFHLRLYCSMPICTDWVIATGDCTYEWNRESWKADHSDIYKMMLHVRGFTRRSAS
ncbi:hypothetical protein GS480_17770 [Rhodococcus hoagii]|nr:hypothetical protein [Prescottella equi]